MIQLPPSCRRRLAPLAVIVAAVAGPASAQSLYVPVPQVIGVVGASGTNNSIKDEHGYHLEDALGANRYELDLQQGSLRFYTNGVAVAGPPGADVSNSASTGFLLNIVNQGINTVVFPEGSFTVDFSVDYNFQPQGFAQGGSRLNFGLGPAYSLNHLLENRAGQPITNVLRLNMPGSRLHLVDVHEATPDRLDLTWRSAAYTLLPGDDVSLYVYVGGNVYLGGGAGVAVIDSWNSLHLRADLPDGVTLSSDLPLHWASPVPEPGGLALAAAGLAVLAANGRRRGRPGPAAPDRDTRQAGADMRRLSKWAALAVCTWTGLSSVALAQVDPKDKAQEAQAVQLADAMLKLADEKGSAAARKLILGPMADGNLPGMPAGAMLLQARNDQLGARDQMLPMLERKLLYAQANRAVWRVAYLSEGTKVGALSVQGRVYEGRFFTDHIEVVFEAGRDPYIRSHVGRPKVSATAD
ncbi:MAG: hypothetical protein IV093_18260 [Rubrivivax sp.]|nr:hypothetical protein [Rubrivivax sp.]